MKGAVVAIIALVLLGAAAWFVMESSAPPPTKPAPAPVKKAEPGAKTPTAPAKPAAETPTKAGAKLRVATWGGAYAASQKAAFFDPFRATKVDVVVDDYNGELAKIKAMVQSGKPTWDVVDLEAETVLRGCDEGLLERLDPKIAGGDPEDFMAGSLKDCGIASVAWSTVIAYDADKLKTPPTKLADFFDLRKFPGKRAMRKVPKSTLEMALLADGVEPTMIYERLSTPQGLDQAFAKLDGIKKEVVWWVAGAQPPQLLADGEVVMAQAYNGRIYNAQVKEKKNFAIIWDGQIYDFDYWAITKGSPNKATAERFLTFALDPARMAVQTKHISYSPTRPSALSKVAPAVLPHLPTAEANFKRALRVDARWWADHFEEINTRFQAWLAK